MRTISKLWETFYAKLNQINPKCPLENEVIKQTMRPSKYKEYAKMIIGKINPQDSILEIGCGFGGLALEILELIPTRYTVVDNKLMLTQAKKYLGKKVTYIDAREIEALQNKKFKLFISHYCLSETPPEYREYILKNIIKNCQEIFIIDLDGRVKLTPKMLKSGHETFPLNIEKWLKKYFIIEKIKLRNNQAMYIGERKKRKLGDIKWQ